MLHYDARRSAQGDVSCATCHAFAHTDHLAWDLGDPRGRFIHTHDPAYPRDQKDPFLRGFHPLKGPTTTLSLRGLASLTLLHWRGDRPGLTSFKAAFRTLLGGAREPSDEEFARYEAFINGVRYPPNPYETLEREYPNPTAGPSARRGFETFTRDRHRGLLRCVDCHSLPLGTNQTLVNRETLRDAQEMRVPQLRGLYDKARGRDRAGFGFTHDGTAESLERYLKRPAFQFAGGDAQRRDVVAFLMAFDTGMAPAVGNQVTVDASTREDLKLRAELLRLVRQARAGNCDVIAKGIVGGEPRGYVLMPDGRFQSDRHGEPELALDAFFALCGLGGTITFTGVPPGTGLRAGIDRDRDGLWDADPRAASLPGGAPDSAPAK